MAKEETSSHQNNMNKTCHFLTKIIRQYYLKTRVYCPVR